MRGLVGPLYASQRRRHPAAEHEDATGACRKGCSKGRSGSDGSPYEKRVDAKGRVLSDKSIAEEVPFEIPGGWTWTRIGALFEMKAGKNIKAAEISEVADDKALYRCYGGNGVRGYVSRFNNEGFFQ